MGGLVVLLSCVSLFCGVSGTLVPTQTFPHSVSLLPGDAYELFWKYDDTTITFEIHVQTKGWVGFGISPNGGMAKSDVVIAWVEDNGEVKFDDRFASGRSLPTVDPRQDWTKESGRETDTHTVITFSRKLKACDSNDLDITDGTVRVIWAYGAADPTDSNEPTYHGTARGTKSIQMINPTVEGTLPNDALTVDFLNPNVSVPSTDTTYWCQVFALPTLASKHHIIKVEPIIQPGHESLVHHILIYACLSTLNSSYEGYAEECYVPNMPGDIQACNSVMFAWAIGGGPLVFPSHAGFPIGPGHSSTYIRLETHYDNPSLTSGITDSSGIRLTYTPTLRPNDIGIIESGVVVFNWHVIPPKFPALSSFGHCVRECLEQSMGNVNELHIVGTMLHSHLLGLSIKVHHIRDGKELPPVAKDAHYDFNFQETRMFKKEVTIKKGDSLAVECVYDSRGRSSYTKGGLRSAEEMCLAYLYYYPAIRMTNCESVPYPAQTLSFANLTGAFDQSRQYIVSSGPHTGKNMYQVISDTDWTPSSTQNAFQNAIRGGTVMARCEATRENSYPVNYQEAVIPEVSTPYVEPDMCSAAAQFSVPVFALLGICLRIYM